MENKKQKITKGTLSMWIKTVACVLSLLLVFYSVPTHVFAEIVDAIDMALDGGDEGTSIAEADTGSKKDVFEVIDRREETVKHFRTDDGSFVAVQYNLPVHERDEKGEWQDIDNTLSATGSEYVTSNARVKFAKKTTGNETLFTLHDGNHKITMTLSGANKKVAGQVTNTQTEFSEDATQLQKLMTLDKLSSKILYPDILAGVDLEYVVESGNIKENIIVKERTDSYNYTFEIKLNHLEAVLCEDGSVSMTDPDTDEVVYTIPKGCMFDADGAYSDGVSYTLANSGNGTCSLTITADEAWINDSERVFPVTVDPPIYSTSTTDNVIDTYIDSDNVSYTYYSYSFLAAGHGSNGQDFISYWKMNDLPTVPANAYVTSVDFLLYCQVFRSHSLNGGTWLKLGVYQATSDWTSGATWSSYASGTCGAYGQLIDFADISFMSEAEYITWDITALYKTWMASSSANKGLAIVQIGDDNADALFTSSNATVNTPRLVINYRDMKGVESYWSGSTHSAGLAGSGYVNHATGNLVFSISTLSTNDGLFGFTPTLIYNTAIADQYNTYAYNPNVHYRYLSAGYGLKLNTNESVVKRTYTGEDGSDQTYYIWSDGDGTEHYFLYDTETQSYRDEDGLSLTLTETQYHMVIEDIHGNLRQFTNSSGTDYIYAGGVLEFIQDIYGNKLRFNYNSKGQTTSVDVVPAGHADSDAILYLTLLYNSLGVLYRITNQVTGQVVTFEYGTSFSDTSYISTNCAGPLRRVKYGHVSGSEIVTDATMYYDYTQAVGATVGSTYRLSSAKDETTGTEIRYTYDWQGQVKTVTEYANNHAGQSVSFTYGKGYTEVRTSGADDILQSGNTGDDIITHYSIDRQGRAVSAYSTNVQRTAMYGATNCVYEDDGENDNAKNSLKSEAVINGVATNYVYNGSFEYGEIDSLGWACSDLEEICIDYDGINSFERWLAISVTANTTQHVYQDVVLPNGTYTVSADFFSYANSGISLQITVTSTDGSVLLAKQVYETYYTASTQNSLCPALTFTVDGGTAGSMSVRVKFEFIGDASASGTVYLDRVMLENNIGAGSYNAIQFGGFEDTLPQTVDTSGMTQWDFQYAPGASVTDRGLNGKGLSIQGDVNDYQYVGQTVNIVPAALIEMCLHGTYSYAAASKSRTFTVSGFAKGSAQVPSEDAFFCIDVEIKYYGDNNEDDNDNNEDDNIEKRRFDFNKELTDW